MIAVNLSYTGDETSEVLVILASDARIWVRVAPPTWQLLCEVCRILSATAVGFPRHQR